jgi:5-methylcytosine-specific restriction endonuclease McrA
VSRSRPGSDKRRAIRHRLARRHGLRCFYCRTPFATCTEGTLDHYVPYTLWPTNHFANFVLACTNCNQAKADRLPWPLVWLLLSPRTT